MTANKGIDNQGCDVCGKIYDKLNLYNCLRCEICNFERCNECYKKKIYLS